MSNITLIVPTYRNPSYLDLCLKSAVENVALPGTSIIVIVDGFVDESRSVLAKYRGIGVLELPHNTGMANAINIGVWNATSENILVINDDNVMCSRWDARLQLDLTNRVITVNQIEPQPSIYNFPVVNFGLSPTEFDYDGFLVKERELASDKETDDGHIFPFLMTKMDFMTVGGFDLYYKSPFYVDLDFFKKLQLKGCIFQRTHRCHLFHFGSRATKNGPEGEKFRASEMVGHQQFQYKWQHSPKEQL